MLQQGEGPHHIGKPPIIGVAGEMLRADLILIPRGPPISVRSKALYRCGEVVACLLRSGFPIKQQHDTTFFYLDGLPLCYINLPSVITTHQTQIFSLEEIHHTRPSAYRAQHNIQASREEVAPREQSSCVPEFKEVWKMRVSVWQLLQGRRVVPDLPPLHGRNADVEHRVEPRTVVGTRVPHVILHQPRGGGSTR